MGCGGTTAPFRSSKRHGERYIYIYTYIQCYNAILDSGMWHVLDVKRLRRDNGVGSTNKLTMISRWCFFWRNRKRYHSLAKIQNEKKTADWRWHDVQATDSYETSGHHDAIMQGPGINSCFVDRQSYPLQRQTWRRTIGSRSCWGRRAGPTRERDMQHRYFIYSES